MRRGAARVSSGIAPSCVASASYRVTLSASVDLGARPGAAAPSSPTTRPAPGPRGASRSGARPGPARPGSAHPTTARTTWKPLLGPMLGDGMTGAHPQPHPALFPVEPAYFSARACLRCSLGAAGPSSRRRSALTVHRVARAAREATRPDGWAVYRGWLTRLATPAKQVRHRWPHDRWPRLWRVSGAGAPSASPPASRPPRRRGPPS
jgi:hypothetical protein